MAIPAEGDQVIMEALDAAVLSKIKTLPSSAMGRTADAVIPAAATAVVIVEVIPVETTDQVITVAILDMAVLSKIKSLPSSAMGRTAGTVIRDMAAVIVEAIPAEATAVVIAEVTPAVATVTDTPITVNRI